jgi:integrase
LRLPIATIAKTESGTWKALIRRKGWPTVSKTFRVKRDAENWGRSTEDEIIRGIYVPRNNSEKLTVAAALDRYVKEVVPTKKEGSQRRDIGRAEFLKSRLGQYSLAALNSELIAGFRDDRLAEGKANNTVRLELALLSHMYTTAIKEWSLGLIANPVLNIRKPSPGQGRSRRLNGDEEQRLLEACDAHSNPFLGWIVRIALYSAMRKSEITSLTREQINLERRTVFLPDTKNNSVRTVPLTNKAYSVIKEALNHPFRPIDTNLIFAGEPGRDGKRKPYVINRVWPQAMERAEISGLRFHDLRHEATSRFVEAGLSDQEVASITGHKSMQMLKRCTHLRSEDLVHKIATI